MKIDSNNNQFEFEDVSIHSLHLLHAVEMYLSANNSLNEAADLSSIGAEEQTIVNEIPSLSLCEINEIIFAIHSSSDSTDERNETLDALASSLREVAEETPFHQQALAQADAREVPEELGQIVVRAVLYEIVMRLFTFSLLVLLCYGS